jgi:hypothetical protein
VEEEDMSRRARLSGFGMEEVAERFPGSIEAADRRGRRHGHGLGLRPNRYVGRHRFLQETNGHKPDRAERRTERRKVGKGNDFGFGG